VTARIRFIAASCIASQRWLAPVVLFAIAVAVLFASGGSPLVNAGVGATVLFPIAAWITIATLNDEDPSQQAITTAAFGSPARVRRAKLAVAVMVCAALAAVSILVAVVRAGSLTLEILAASSFGHVLAVAGGLALGATCARPLVKRNGSALLLVAGATVVDLVVPDAPPAHLVLSALSGVRGPRWSLLGLAAVGTTVLGSALLGLSGRITRSAG
jgi:hypothetical protein